MPDLWQALAVRIIAGLCPPDAPVVIDLDDTLFHRTGRSIEGAGVFRDAVASTRNRVVHAWGLNLVVVTVRITAPWGGMPVGLPVNARVRRKDRADTTVSQTHVSLRRAVANTIVSQMLPEGVVKGGTAMKLRVGGLGRVHRPACRAEGGRAGRGAR